MKWLTGALIASLLAWSGAAAVAGTDLPGNDYDDFPAGSALICRDSCGGDPQCRAFTFVRPGVQRPSGHCWLKNQLPRAVSNNCCVSGGRNLISPASLTPENGTDRPGSDFRNFNVDSAAACQVSCEDDGACRSWTFVSKGVQGPRAHCWLKNAVARPVPNPKTVSGVKYKGASVRID